MEPVTLVLTVCLATAPEKCREEPLQFQDLRSLINACSSLRCTSPNGPSSIRRFASRSGDAGLRMRAAPSEFLGTPGTRRLNLVGVSPTV